MAVKKTVAMTIYDRTPEVIEAVFTGLWLPGNKPDIVCVCYDRAPQQSVNTFRDQCDDMEVELLEVFLEENKIGPRCPSRAWNMCLKLAFDQDNVFCMSSDMVMAPHSLGMAYHLAETAPGTLIVSRAEHCGQSYTWRQPLYFPNGLQIPENRMITCSYAPSPLGFAWLMPMPKYREINGFDEVYMEGFCYEDDDFVIRLWKDGVDFIFCDDIMGFHLEHKRDHLKNKDGRVGRNARLFENRWGDINYLKDKHLHKDGFCGALAKTGLAFWMHEKNEKLVMAICKQQNLYGNDEPWRSVKGDDDGG